jgi:hypothetical protein
MVQSGHDFVQELVVRARVVGCGARCPTRDRGGSSGSTRDGTVREWVRRAARVEGCAGWERCVSGHRCSKVRCPGGVVMVPQWQPMAR